MPSTLSRHLLIFAVLGCAGCAARSVDFSVQVRNDCVPHAHSVQLSVRYWTWPSAVLNATALQSIEFRVDGVPRTARVDLADGRLTLPIAADGSDGLALGSSVVLSGRVPTYFTQLEVDDVAFFTDPPEAVSGDPPCVRTALPGLLATGRETLGPTDWKLHVQHLSSKAREPLTVDDLQWAGARQALDPSKLTWGNPEIESLHWQQLIPHGGRQLQAGDDLLYDIPDSALAEYPVWLVRIVSSGPTANQRGIAQFVPTAGVTPTRRLTWGEIKAKYR
jgi:hypothetical protein